MSKKRLNQLPKDQGENPDLAETILKQTGLAVKEINPHSLCMTILWKIQRMINADGAAIDDLEDIVPNDAEFGIGDLLILLEGDGLVEFAETKHGIDVVRLTSLGRDVSAYLLQTIRSAGTLKAADAIQAKLLRTQSLGASRAPERSRSSFQLLAGAD